MVAVRAALDRKDPEAVKSVAGAATETLVALLNATGAADSALEHLKALSLPKTALVERERLEEVVDRLRRDAPDLCLTLDPVENRGFEYHTGIGFTIFARGISGELARGGRYRVQGNVGDDAGERATGVTLYVDTILGMLPKTGDIRRILIPSSTSRDVKTDLQSQGWVSVSALEDGADLALEAHRLACSHFLGEAGPEPVKG